MAKASPAIVLAKAVEHYDVSFNNATRYRTRFELIHHIKGDIATSFATQNHRLKQGELNRVVFGDMEFVEGATYLLFLVNRGDYWQPMMQSHGVFQQWERNGQLLLSPVEEGLNHFVLQRPDGQTVEPFYVYDSKKMIKLLRRVVDGQADWNSAKARTDYPVHWFQAAQRAAPSHCTFLGAPAPLARWTDFPGTALPVYYGSTGDAGCATANAKVQSVITSLNTNYTGLNLSDGGTHTFVPTCTGGEGATDNEFTTWVGNTLGGTRHLVVQYDDPCDEIADLVGCNGTLAFGGFYWFSSTHIWDGTNWNPGAYGYVVVNNGTGACQCPSTDYDIMMTHEITHALGMGHISTGDGAANMNPSCCESMSALDVECLDYTYAPEALPVELAAFDGQLVDKKSHLRWTTISEQNNDYFTLERSQDGRNFAAIGTVSGQGTTNTPQHYSFVDAQPRLGKNYYRLRQTDFDGQEEWIGEVIAIDYHNQGIISIQPNPIRTDLIQFALVAAQQSEMTVELVDLNGKVLHTAQYELGKGRNDLQLLADQLSNGLYLLRTTIGNDLQIHRVLKTQ
ncbi:MAG: zinc-dependent metalloprotease [Bacteroidota bacterium]